MSVTSWFLVSSSGTRHRLPREMIFVGRDDCELMLQSRSVDKQHAVINYDPNTDEHMVKDLGSLNGTFVNDLRIPDQTYITLKLSDVIRFGYDILYVFHLTFPHFSLICHQLKFPAQLEQFRLVISGSHQNDPAVGTPTDSPISKPTPLYGQPSWWGDDEDPANKKQSRGGKQPGQESSGQDMFVVFILQAKSIFSYRREPSYFEIPTKEFQQRPAKKPEPQVYEVPTKDTPNSSESVPSTPTPPVVQSHASFTIEFDECTPGKMKIKDHITKFSFRQQRRLSSSDIATTPTEVMSAESKVADWLVHSNASMMRRRSRTEDMYSTNSDPSMLKTNHWEDGTQEPLPNSPPESQSLSGLGKAEPHQAFVIEFFDENSRKKRSQSFTTNSTQAELPGQRPQVDKSRKSTSPTEERHSPSPASTTPPTQAGSLRREKAEDRISNSFSSRSTSSVSIRPFSSVGRKSKLAQEFTAELLKQAKQGSSSKEKNASSSTGAETGPQGGPRNEEEDSLSDAGTYTIEADVQDKELEEARSKIDQVPPGQKSDIPTPSIHVHYDLHSTFDVDESSSVTPRSQSSLHRLSVQDDVEPDSLSDASKSDDGSIIERRRRPLPDTEERKKEDNPTMSVKSTSFYIGSDDTVSKSEDRGSKPSTPKMERKQVAKTFSTATLTKRRSSQDSGKVKPSGSAPVLRAQSPETREGGVTSLVRQESFTKDRPSNARLPNISSQPIQRSPEPESFPGSCNQDTRSYLRETEDVLVALEAKLQAAQSVPTPSPVMDSLSGESDVDTSSTVSQHSNRTKQNTVTAKPSNSGFHREKSSMSTASQDSNNQSSASERVTEKRFSQGVDRNHKTETFRRPVGLRRSSGKCGSTDLSDDPQGSNVPFSDQESNAKHTSKKYTVPLQREDAKNSKVALGRTNSLSAPRATRASMLRRARLGESDNEGTETDRLSQEAGNAPVKQPQETKKLSRLDMLAMPRKRTSSFNTPSDTEASSTPQWTGRTTGFSNRSTDGSGTSVRRASGPGPKPAERPQKAALTKAPVSRGRSGSAKYASSSRRRQKGSDYTSTSDEEYDTNQSTPKHKRSQPSSASHGPRNQPRPQPVVALRSKPRSRDSEDENHEGDAFHNWRPNLNLAKDLAILAREIHDVAGDGDQQNCGAESGAPTSTIVLLLVQNIPEAGSNYQRAPPGSAAAKDPEQNSSDGEQKLRQRAQSRDEVIVDNVMLNPVSQIIVAIRENTEELTEKIKVLFQDKMDMWEEIEAKLDSENDLPVVKTSNKEMTSILKELRRVQWQLEVLNTVIEPSGQSEATRTSAPPVSSSGVRSSKPTSSRDWRTVHSVSKRGGGPRPGESIRRAAVTPNDVREGYLV
uniref:Centrosomal protein 170B n=1 Tax=Sphaeramia orbicularis TaxID=375764 RepID=A0A673CJ74_9TELE